MSGMRDLLQSEQDLPELSMSDVEVLEDEQPSDNQQPELHISGLFCICLLLLYYMPMVLSHPCKLMTSKVNHVVSYVKFLDSIWRLFFRAFWTNYVFQVYNSSPSQNETLVHHCDFKLRFFQLLLNSFVLQWNSPFKYWCSLSFVLQHICIAWSNKTVGWDLWWLSPIYIVIF